MIDTHVWLVSLMSSAWFRYQLKRTVVLKFPFRIVWIGFYMSPIWSLINYCYNPTTSNCHRLGDPAYANILRPEHRQINYDFVSDWLKARTIPITRCHGQHVRRSKKSVDGVFSSRPYKKGIYRPDSITVPERQNSSQPWTEPKEKKHRI